MKAALQPSFISRMLFVFLAKAIIKRMEAGESDEKKCALLNTSVILENDKHMERVPSSSQRR